MLTELSTVKARLGIPGADTQHDTILTNAILGVSALFDRECRRTFARSIDAVEEFDGDATELRVACYPIESVSRLELKTDEATGWVEAADAEFLIRGGCVVSLTAPLGTARQQGRVIYTGGYVLPGATPEPGQTALPEDVHQAAVEQVACWFQNRDKLGLLRNWPSSGTFQQFMVEPLLPFVRAVLSKHERWLV